MSKDAVCIYTTAKFVEVLVKGLSLEFEGVYCTSDEDELLKKSNTKEIKSILIYSETLAGSALARLALKVTCSNSQIDVFLLEDLQKPKLHRIHPTEDGQEHCFVQLENLELGQIIGLIRGGFKDLELDEDPPRLTLTKHQWAVLKYVGEGLSNAEIASLRNCTPRAVETILNRTAVRLGIDSALSSRGRTAAMLEFLKSAK